MNTCTTCLIRNRAICSSLGPSELEVLNQIGRRQVIKRGQVLIWEGDESFLVANVIEGVLKLSTSTADGREQIVGVVYPSDFIGRPFGNNSQHTVTALTDARVCSFTRRAFDGFAREHPELEHKLLERTLIELDRARNWMLLLGRKNASEKVCSLLLEMSHRLADSTCSGSVMKLDQFEMPVDRQQMADLLGLTIETISRQITRLRSAKIIDTPDRRSILILNRALLAQTAGEAEAA